MRLERDLGNLEVFGNITANGSVSGTNIIDNNISGRAGTPLVAMQIETQAQIDANPALATNESVLCSNCAPLTDSGGATIDFSEGAVRYDDRAVDAATITFSNLTVDTELQVGAFAKIRYNRASEPAYAGATMKQLPNTLAFPASTECVGVYEVNDDGEIDYYFYEVTP